jgi:hypothetical protein
MIDIQTQALGIPRPDHKKITLLSFVCGLGLGIAIAALTIGGLML